MHSLYSHFNVRTTYSPYDFGQNLVNGMDRSYLKRGRGIFGGRGDAPSEVTEAKLVDAKEVGKKVRE
jgi:hypothetical protein